jgi:hypothetical protein
MFPGDQSDEGQVDGDVGSCVQGSAELRTHRPDLPTLTSVFQLYSSQMAKGQRDMYLQDKNVPSNGSPNIVSGSFFMNFTSDWFQ